MREAKSILQTLATGVGESKLLSALESDLDDEHNVHSNYRSNHNTPDKPEEDDLEHTPTPETETTLPTPPFHEINPDQQTERTAKSIPTPPPDQQSEEKNDCMPRPLPAQPLDKDTML